MDSNFILNQHNQSCCFKTTRNCLMIFRWRREIKFFFQMTACVILVAFSLYNVTHDTENTTLWVAVLSTCIGNILPNPTIKRRIRNNKEQARTANEDIESTEKTYIPMQGKEENKQTSEQVKEVVKFLCQIAVIYAVIGVSIYNIMHKTENINLWAGLMTSSLGYLMPSPRSPVPRRHSIGKPKDNETGPELKSTI